MTRKNGINADRLEQGSFELLRKALERLNEGFSFLSSSSEAIDLSKVEQVLTQVAERLKDNYPYFHPLYAGQMLKPPHPIARLAYALSLWINPNNHALDGGRASSAMEKEAVGELARMVGWDSHLGHLCSGGTVANLEALWIAGQIHPGKTIVASEQAHYTHDRISKVLGLPFEAASCDSRGRMDADALKHILSKGTVGTIVATMGTTSTGSVDRLQTLLDLRPQYEFRIHADAAYGGYFSLIDNLSDETQQSLSKMSEVDSLVIDPHKHGLQPYGCGCVLFKDPGIGQYYKHESPYTYFSSGDLHLGEISLECSRPGAAAVALWATQQLLPLVRGGEFAERLSASRTAALAFHQKLKEDERFLTPFPPELDIIVWAIRSPRTSISSELARRVFAETAKRNLHLALAELPVDLFETKDAGMKCDTTRITCLRSVLMKPEHGEWLDRIWGILDESTNFTTGTF